jgi:hypothetical protein
VARFFEYAPDQLGYRVLNQSVERAFQMRANSIRHDHHEAAIIHANQYLRRTSLF